MDAGTHFAAPTEGSIVVAEELRRRWGLPFWRFTNSGTESTMDAVHLARGATGQRRDDQDRGHLPRPPRRRDGLGQAARRADGRARPPQRRPLRPRLPVDHGGADAARPLQRRRRARARCSPSSRARSPGVILEPAMMNINIVPPLPGYLERVRELATRARRRADLRRGQDRRGGRGRRRDRAVRRHARRRLPRQGDLRRPARRRRRHDRRARRARGRRPRPPAGHVQRQPARDGRRPGDAAGGPHARRPTRSCTRSTPS